MRLVQGISKRAWKMDHHIWQKTHGLHFLRSSRRVSSDDGQAIEPSADTLDFRGRAQPQEVRHRILTTDESSPHLEWKSRHSGGPGALGSCEDRVYGAVPSRR